MFITEFHYDDERQGGGAQKQWVEVTVPSEFDYRKLAVLSYTFDNGGNNQQHNVAWLNGSQPSATIINNTLLPSPSTGGRTLLSSPDYGWRVLVLDLPGNIQNAARHVDGLALVVFCNDSSSAVTDFVCYGASDGNTTEGNNPVARTGLAQGECGVGSSRSCLLVVLCRQHTQRRACRSHA